jgi:hypothetical protein
MSNFFTIKRSISLLLAVPWQAPKAPRFPEISGLTAHPSSSLSIDGSELGVKKARARTGPCTPTSAKALPQPRSMGKRN